jgi:phage baseplate assembly protein W
VPSNIENDLNPNVSIGLSLPLGVHQNGVFKQTQTLLEQTKSNIKNLLLTRRGERLGNPRFGSDLLKAVFEPVDGETENKIEEAIRSSISEYLPHVQIKSIEFSTRGSTINPKIVFTIDTDNTSLEEITLDLPSLEDADTGEVGNPFSRHLGG